MKHQTIDPSICKTELRKIFCLKIIWPDGHLYYNIVNESGEIIAALAAVQ